MVDSWSDYEELVKTWRSQIMRHVDSVPVSGVLGTCVPYGDRSAAILSGGPGPQNVCMAAASLGLGGGGGRVFVIAHDCFINNATFREQPAVKTLLKNIYAWASNGTYRTDDDVYKLKIGKNNSFADKKILIWSGGKLDEDSSARVLEFVMNGGGLVHAKTPWGWLQRNPNKMLEDMPLVEILTAAGIYYTADTCDNRGHFDVNLSDAASHDEATQNVRYMLARLLTSREELARYGERLCQGLAATPHHVEVLLRDEMKALYDCHKNSQAHVPCSSEPLSDPTSRCIALLCDKLCNMGDSLELRSIPRVEDFPGDCEDGGQAVCTPEKEYSAKLANFHSTGLYARPGAEIVVDVIGEHGSRKDGWIFRIGSHTDEITKLDKWKRWPKLAKYHKLDTPHLETFSPYGGLIYLENPTFKEAHSITVKISGAVQSPRFQLTSPTSEEDWLACREAPGPWADMNGRYITFTMPASSVRHLDDPATALAVWDAVVEAHCNLRGTDPSDLRHQWVVCDPQPVVGYMHAGYPIVTMMDVADPKASDRFLLDADYILSKGCWGMFHELGHNMQRPWWSFQGTGEVTCNIFTLHAMDIVSGKQPWIHEWLAGKMSKIQKALKKDDPYEDWVQHPEVALGIYAQLQHCFGWQAYKTVFAHYESLEDSKRPQGNDNQVAYWIEQFSNTVNYNLCPLFEFWGFKLADALVSGLSMPPFLPDDEMTSLAPERVKLLQEIYPGLVREPRGTGE